MWVLISLMVVKNRRVFYPAAIGFGLMFLGFAADFSDEFVQTPRIFIFLEKLGLFAGMIIASIGVYSWARSIQTGGDNLEKKVEARTLELKNENAEMSAVSAKSQQKLHEANLRMKKNLQLIESLLRMQMRSTNAEHAQDIFKNLYNRINSVAVVHNLLDQGEGGSIPAQSYIKKLVANVISTFEIDPNRIQCVFEIGDIALGSDCGTLCGMIINELVTNSLKHAFPNERKGKVTVHLSGTPGRYELRVSDDGIGLPGKIRIAKSRTMGFRLVTAWTRQLQGTAAVERDEGTAIRISFQDGIVR